MQCIGQLEPKGASGTGGAGAVDACAEFEYEPEKLWGDLYFLMDRSISQSRFVAGSTTIRRWDVLRNAIAAFAQEVVEKRADVRIGLGFFGRTGGDADELDCDVSYYATPKVAIGAVPMVGQAVVNAILEQVPMGLTPTRPALEGAHRYAATYAAANPGRSVSVVLLTDGYPTQCDGNTVNITGLKTLAERAFETAARVRTFVIGLEGEGNLNAIARSGGTQQAYIVDLENDTSDVSAKLLTVLKSITNDRVPCHFSVPEPEKPGEIVDTSKVQVLLTPHDAATENLYAVPSAAGCGDKFGGWYYDDPVSPETISLCPCNCAKFAAGTASRVNIRLGCAGNPVPE